MDLDRSETLVAAAIARQGIVYIPRFLACEALRDGRLVALPLDAPTIGSGGVYPLTHPSRRVAAKT